MKKAIGYLRVSTENQVDKYGFSAQEETVRAYALQNGIEVVHIFREEAVSGSTEMDDRLQLANCLDFMRENEINICIIPELSRLARDLMIQETIIGKFREENYELISCLEPDLMEDDPMRKAFRQFRGLMNEFERAMITMRLKGGIIQKAKTGGHATGRIPLGYKSVTEGGKKSLTVDEREKEIVQLIFKLKDEMGFGFKRIADYLNDNGYKPKRWTPENPVRFHNSSVQVIYKNPKYRGIVTFNSNGECLVKTTNEALRIL